MRRSRRAAGARQTAALLDAETVAADVVAEFATVANQLQRLRGMLE